MVSDIFTGYFDLRCRLTLRSVPSLRLQAHSLSLSFSCMVIACRSSDTGFIFSHKNHCCTSSVVLCIFEYPTPGSFWMSAALFRARSSLLLLIIRQQLRWYFALFLLSVSSMPPHRITMVFRTTCIISWRIFQLVLFICLSETTLSPVSLRCATQWIRRGRFV